MPSVSGLSSEHILLIRSSCWGSEMYSTVQSPVYYCFQFRSFMHGTVMALCLTCLWSLTCRWFLSAGRAGEHVKDIYVLVNVRDQSSLEQGIRRHCNNSVLDSVKKFSSGPLNTRFYIDTVDSWLSIFQYRLAWQHFLQTDFRVAHPKDISRGCIASGNSFDLADHSEVYGGSLPNGSE